MNVGVVSDVHGNRIALEAVLEDMPDVAVVVNAGDVVGYNPWPAECVEAIRQREIPTVMGNHDRVVAQGSTFRGNELARAGVEHAKRALDDAQREWLAGLPRERTVLDGRIKLVHGHPENPDRYTYPEEFRPALLGEEDVLVMGHTHVQGAAGFPEGVVLNPGSVGQPRDGDPRAAYAVVDPTTREVDLRRVEYDIEHVIDAVEAAGLPLRIGSRLREGR